MKLSTRLLIKVSDRGEIAGSRIYLLPIVPDALTKPEFTEPLKPGDELELGRPDGSVASVLQALRRPLTEYGGLFIRIGAFSHSRRSPESALKFCKVERLPVRL
jgi:hypothetical protein